MQRIPLHGETKLTTRRKTQQPERTPEQAYAELATDVQRLMKDLAKALDAHRARFGTGSTDWNHVEELRQAWGQLADALGPIERRVEG